MSKICQFDIDTFSFQGTPLNQARCLLRQVQPLGQVADTAAVLPQSLEKLVGLPVDISGAHLVSFLASTQISADDIGGALTDPLSRTDGEDGPVRQATYFVIHDTSTLLSEKKYKEAGAKFPESINTRKWPGNDLGGCADIITHVVVNRLGESRTVRNYKRPRRATKFEARLLRNKHALLGLFLHNELVQPRLNNIRGTDEYSPNPGYTQAQYERLALCYIAASVRGGLWLVPCFHAVVDLDIPNAHDDPQHFDLNDWAAALERLRSRI